MLMYIFKSQNITEEDDKLIIDIFHMIALA